MDRLPIPFEAHHASSYSFANKPLVDVLHNFRQQLHKGDVAAALFDLTCCGFFEKTKAHVLLIRLLRRFLLVEQQSGARS